MANAKEIQDRMKSINDTLKITNAMYMISSSKLKKSKKMLTDTEPYFFTLQSEMSRILRHLPDLDSIYFRSTDEIPEEEKRIAYMVVTADKGLAGSYNHNILKIAEEELAKHPKRQLYVLGEVGRHYFEERGIEIDAAFAAVQTAPQCHDLRGCTPAFYRPDTASRCGGKCCQGRCCGRSARSGQFWFARRPAPLGSSPCRCPRP